MQLDGVMGRPPHAPGSASVGGLPSSLPARGLGSVRHKQRESAMSYTPEIRDRLAKALRLMASPHDGEALAAARAAHRIIESAGVTWDAVLAQAGDGALGQPPKPRWAYRVWHPTGALPPLSPPRDTWRMTLTAIVQADAGTPAQKAYVGTLLRSGSTADPDWRPSTYAMASAITRMHDDCFGGKAA